MNSPPAEESIRKMPVLFLGHGTPMNALEDNRFAQGWRKLAREIPRPRAILCVSAHWRTRGVQVTAMERPRTIHDFHGFPQPLFDLEYPCPGAPELARETIALLAGADAREDLEWGLDHGTWSVLVKMYPEADIPTYQLSLDATRDFRAHFELARLLTPLREAGVLIAGSGNIVHNLAHVRREDPAPPHGWAIEFDALVTELLDRRDHDDLIDYRKFGRAAELSVNSGEHYLPLIYAAALSDPGESVSYVNDSIAMGALSMRCVRFG